MIIDLVAIHRDDVADKNEYYNTNVVGAKNIATVCSEKNISKIIFFNSFLYMVLPQLEQMKMVKLINLMNMVRLNSKLKRSIENYT